MTASELPPEPPASPRDPTSWKVALAVGVASWVLLSAIYGFQTARRIPLAAPPAAGDGPDYESIAWNLWHGRGFAIDYGDPEWRAPYAEHNANGKYDYLLAADHVPGLTAYRPPLLPMMITAIYTVTGRDFAPLRIVNGLWMAAAVSLFVIAAYRHFGVSAAAILLLAAAADTELHAYAGAILTESLGAFWMSAVLVALPTAFTGRWGARFAAAGLCFGVMMLSRSIFALWIPVLLLIVAVMAWRSDSFRWRKAIRAGGLFAGCAIAVALPWWIRNCLVLESFRPLGTQGSASLVGGYCDDSLARGGLWSGEPQVEIATELRRDPSFDRLPAWQREIIIDDRCREEAFRWALEHWRDLPRLTLGKLYHLWYRPSWLHTLFYVPVAAGVVLSVWRPALRWPVAMLVINSLLVMALYSTGGRFLVPVRPAMHFLAAAAVAALISYLNRLLRRPDMTAG